MFRIIPEGLAYKEHVILKDGQGLLFRPASPSDIPKVQEFMKRVSRESLRMRFMAAVSEVPPDVIKNLCEGDFTESGCLLAITSEGSESKIVGLGNYIAMGNKKSAEIAFLVEDDYQGKGISTLLLERLAGLAAANGYIEFEAEVLPDNQPMINVFKSSGFEVHKVWHSDTVHVELPTNGAAATWRKSNLRERIAVANSLIPLLQPKSVAVVGASRDPSSIGHMIFKNILNGNFQGTIYPVNPEAVSVNGVKAYSSLQEIPEKIDLSVISIPAEKVLEVAEKSIKSGAKGLLVVSAGFAEAGEEGSKRQKDLVKLVREHGVRLLGPSCLGLMNTDPKVHLNASLAPNIVQRGSAGFFSHSAALGLVILEYAMEKGVGFTTFVSAGNRADVSGNDLLLYWEEDANTKMAILYLETFGNPRRFVRIAKRMSYKKPILCVKSARSAEGRKTAEAKSGTMSGKARPVEALFRQTGIILTETLEELFDVAVVLDHQPIPKGNRVSILANSAGVATIFADSCESNGLELAGPKLVNLGAFTSPESYETKVYEALVNEDVDSLLVGYACVGQCGSEPVAAAIRKGVSLAEKEMSYKKPVLLCLMGETGSISLVKEKGKQDEQRMFPAFRFPESAARALGRIVRYAEYCNKPPGKLVWFEDVKPELARQEIQSILSNLTSQQTVEVETSKAENILKYFGLDVTQTSKPDNPFILKVKPDPLFGPLIEIVQIPSLKIVRITPLTDQDINEILENLSIENKSNFSSVLGRISQMIEEIPWLWKLQLNVVVNKDKILISNVSISLNPAAKRPAY